MVEWCIGGVFMVGISWGLFGEELKELRKAHAIEVKSLADKVGCDSNQIINMEQKKKFHHCIV